MGKDYAEAVKWFRKAAEQGIAGAQHNLGFYYSSGTGVKKDEAEALKWYRNAAGQGLDQAMVIFARMCEDGQGMEKNLAEAYGWYALSSKKHRCESLKSIMSKQQLEEGKKRAKALQEQINARMKNGKSSRVSRVYFRTFRHSLGSTGQDLMELVYLPRPEGSLPLKFRRRQRQMVFESRLLRRDADVVSVGHGPVE